MVPRVGFLHLFHLHTHSGRPNGFPPVHVLGATVAQRATLSRGHSCDPTTKQLRTCARALERMSERPCARAWDPVGSQGSEIDWTHAYRLLLLPAKQSHTRAAPVGSPPVYSHSENPTTSKNQTRWSVEKLSNGFRIAVYS